MFIRSVKVPSSSGEIHEYVRIVASVREAGKTKQKVVANLGRKDVLVGLLPQLNKLLSGSDEDLVDIDRSQGPLQVLDASTWGPLLAVRKVVADLRMLELLDEHAEVFRSRKTRLRGRGVGDDWQSRIIALIANRLTDPRTEHGLAAWLESDYVCDRKGCRYIPQWQQNQRVKVAFKQLQKWYRALDHLIAIKAELEVGLYCQLRDLFSLEPDFVLFDITSTYFEGRGPEKAKHGHSRDGKPQNVQVVIGVVMVAGWPITHYIWDGNTRDCTTVAEVIKDLEQRFKFKRIIFVGDRGMVSESNLALLQAGEATGFLTGMNRRRNPEAEALIDQIDEARWEDCPVGINAMEKENPPVTRVQEVQCEKAGVRVFVVDSDERREYEERMREQSMSRALVDLKKVQMRVAAGKLKSPEKIGASVERALHRNFGYRYYGWKLEDGKLLIYEHPVNLAREKKFEGKYIIQTDQTDITPRGAVECYKELSEVERGFRSLKSPISMRPICHRREDRVDAHIFIAALAFLVERFIERKLKSAGSILSVRDALIALRTIRFVQFQINGEQKTGVTAGSSRAREVLRILNIANASPPACQEVQKTIM